MSGRCAGSGTSRALTRLLMASLRAGMAGKSNLRAHGAGGGAAPSEPDPWAGVGRSKLR